MAQRLDNMSDSSSSDPPAPVAKSSKPASEALLNEKVPEMSPNIAIQDKLRLSELEYQGVVTSDITWPGPQSSCLLSAPMCLSSCYHLSTRTMLMTLGTHLVGPRYLITSHPILSRPWLRRHLLGPPL